MTPKPALLRERDRHGAFRDGIHGGAEQGNIEPDALCQPRRDVNLSWHTFAVTWLQEHIVECDSVSLFDLFRCHFARLSIHLERTTITPKWGV